MPELSSDITAIAFVAANGELAWHPRDVEHALTAIRNAGLAILGGEVWLISDQQSWKGLIPSKDGGPPSVWQWETKPRSSTETWQKYCDRAFSESIEAIQSMNVVEETPEELREQLRFNITFAES